MASSIPRLSVGLPVYNGERYLAGSIESLIGQSYEDFELIISDNSSTDGTANICRFYEKADSRIRYFRQPTNVGLSANHNFVVEQARGELFKWASYDDLYARELLERCVNALDARPQVVLAHSWSARVDNSGNVTKAIVYQLATASPHAPERFRSLLFDRGGDDIYGVVRMSAMRRALPYESYHRSDRTFVTKLGLQGPFYQVADWLYFRRSHAGQAGAGPTTHDRSANMDPRRTNRLRHPAVRLYGEYLWAYIQAIRNAQLSRADRRACYGHLMYWLARSAPGLAPQPEARSAPLDTISIETIVPGQKANAADRSQFRKEA
jgi:glycosyltransferase involved in cell wall biosynthesis